MPASGSRGPWAARPGSLAPAARPLPRRGPRVAYLAIVVAATLKAVSGASKLSPGHWQNCYWVCVAQAACEAASLPLILVMSDRWSPRKARRDAEDHERRLAEELAPLQAGSEGPATAAAGAD